MVDKIRALEAERMEAVHLFQRAHADATAAVEKLMLDAGISAQVKEINRQLEQQRFQLQSKIDNLTGRIEALSELVESPS
jgi:hypothetical protein